VRKIIKDITMPDATPVLCYGAPAIGKSFLIKNLIKNELEKSHHFYVDYIDCNALSA